MDSHWYEPGRIGKIVNMPSIGFPDSKVHGADMGPIWDRQDPDGSHVVPIYFVSWVGDPDL